jgi:hypothetical protein
MNSVAAPNGGSFARLPPAPTTFRYLRASAATATGLLSVGPRSLDHRGREGPPQRAHRHPHSQSTTHLVAADPDGHSAAPLHKNTAASGRQPMALMRPRSPLSCLIQTEASDTNVRHPGRRLTTMRHRLLDLVRQHRRRIDLPHARRDDRCPQLSHVLEALQFSALPVPHDQRDRTAASGRRRMAAEYHGCEVSRAWPVAVAASRRYPGHPPGAGPGESSGTSDGCPDQRPSRG